MRLVSFLLAPLLLFFVRFGGAVDHLAMYIFHWTQLAVLEKEYSFTSVRRAAPTGDTMVKELSTVLKSKILQVRPTVSG